MKKIAIRSIVFLFLFSIFNLFCVSALEERAKVFCMENDIVPLIIPEAAHDIEVSEGLEVTEEGVLAVIKGTHRISYFIEEEEKVFDIIVKSRPTFIKLNKNQIALGVGENFKLKFSVDADSYLKTVDYSVDGDSVIVGENGLITAIKKGSSVVSVTINGELTDECVVDVFPAPDSVKLNKDKITIGVGESFNFDSIVPKGTASNCRLYSVNKEGILSYSGAGIYTALKKGNVKVTVETYNGKKATCNVTVLSAPKNVFLNKSELVIGVGESFNFNSSVDSGTASYYRKYSSNSDILENLGSGVFKAKKKGTAVVTVKTYNGKKAKCKVTVLSAPDSISLNKTKLDMGVGESFGFKSSVEKDCASYHRKYSSNSDILEYLGSGVFKAKKEGTAIVTVEAYNGKKAKCRVNVKPLPKSISVKNSYISMYIGHKKTIDIVLPSGTACISFNYSSSDPSVLKVSKNGIIQAVKNGNASITVKAKGGAKARVNVSVSSMPVPFVNQNPTYPTGCEAASCVELLRYYGIKISLDEMVNTIPRQNITYYAGKRYGPDINKSFVGNPRGTYTSGNPGYGAFSPCITKSLNKALLNHGSQKVAKNISKCSFSELLNQISNGRPAIVWATYKMLVPKSVNSWYIKENGTERYFEYPRGTHVFVLIGWGDDYVTVMDPILGKQSYNINTFQNRWNLLGKQAIVLT